MSKEQDGVIYQMTSEQRTNLKRFGKKNGLSEQQLQAQLSPQKTQQQPVTKTQPKMVPATENKPVAQPVQQPITQQVVQSAQQPIVQPFYEDCQTYFSHQEEDGGNLEIDLITFREKGVETRYLSMLFSGLDTRQNPPSPQSAFLNIESKEEFERIKAFFSQLEWED